MESEIVEIVVCEVLRTTPFICFLNVLFIPTDCVYFTQHVRTA